MDNIGNTTVNADHEVNSLTFSPLSTEDSETQDGSLDTSSSKISPLILSYDEEGESEVKTPISLLDDELPVPLLEPPMKKQMIERPLRTSADAEVSSSSTSSHAISFMDYLRKREAEHTIDNAGPVPFPLVRTSTNSSTLHNIDPNSFKPTKRQYGREEHKTSHKAEPKIQLPSEASTESRAPVAFIPFPILPLPKSKRNGSSTHEKTNAPKPEVVNLVSPEQVERARSLFGESLAHGTSRNASRAPRNRHPVHSHSNSNVISNSSNSREENDPIRKQLLEDEELARRLQQPPKESAPLNPDELLARQLELEERNQAMRMRAFPGSFVSYHPPELQFNFGGNETTSDAAIARRFQAAEFGARRRELPFPSALQTVLGGFKRGRGGSSNMNPALLQLSLMGRDFTDSDYEMLLKLDESVENRKGAKKKTIESLPTFTIENQEQVTSCCVCLNEMEIGNIVRKLPCEHYFHVECIDKWLELNRTCPIDKKEVN